MPNIRIISYGYAEVTGNEMPLFVLGQNVRRWFSPNNENIVLIESRRFLHSNQLELNSAANIPFSIGIRFNPGNRSVGQIQYNCNYIMVADRWVISENRIRRISPCVSEPVNEILSITVDTDRFQHIKQARIDISLNGGDYAAMILGLNGVIFIRFNGNYLMNRYGIFIHRAIIERMLQNRTNDNIQPEPDQIVDVAKIRPLQVEQNKPDLVENTEEASVPMVDFSSIRSESTSEHHPYPSLLREGPSRTIKYVVWNFLGSGSFGKCFRIANFLITKKFACKFIDEKIMSRELIKNEIDIVRSLKHRNVIEYIESFSYKGYMCVILSLCARSLSSFIELKNGDIALSDCRYFIAQILNGIDFIHSKDIIHRDLKPSNILLTDLMEVKISDFGLAIHKDDAQTNETCGTIQYVSPEVLRYDGFSFASDIWAVGVILFELVNRNLPFRGGFTDELVENIKTSDYTIQENCDNEAETLIQIMLEKDAFKRPNAGECLRENFIARHEIIVPEIIDYEPNEIFNVVSEPDSIH